MAHDVFISYSTKDKHAADAVCAVLERNGTRCWIAPRDVMPGTAWGSAIVNAIHASKIIVLVFSGNANTSPQIEREVERAISRSIPIIPFRIEDVQPSDSLEYFISASHWLDAFTQPFEQHLEKLSDVVRRILEANQSKTIVPPGDGSARPAPVAEIRTAPVQALPESPVAGSPPARSRSLVWAIGGAALVLCVLAGAFATFNFKSEPVRRAGDVFSDCEDCPQMTVVPGGSFLMGAGPQEQSGFDWARLGEQPVHEVRISKPFAAGLYAVTRDQFQAFVRATNRLMEGCNHWGGDKEALDTGANYLNPKLGGGAQAGDHPVICVSFEDAAKYTEWLSSKTGHRYRLLSDAEHEYVTRAGTTTAFWWGPKIIPDQANYWSETSYMGSPTAPTRWVTVPVRYFNPNPWGLYQVHGNVAEWVADCWHADYFNSPTDGSVWKVPVGADCNKRTLRGGGFGKGPDLLRSAHRRDSADIREIMFGFRVAQTLGN
jgi:formylglycine-generating enzyme required for sulfatase activity